MQENSVIIIGGSTGSGKSSLAMDLAVELNGIIINADSMQLYQDIPIISACPTEIEKNQIPHKLFEIFKPCENTSIADWLPLVKKEILLAWSKKKTPIVVGGTGMYINILINGMSPIPESPKDIREKTSTIIKDIGKQGLHKLLKEIDPESAKRINENDQSRIKRAYEVWLDTKKTISAWHKMENIKILPEAKFFIINIIPSIEEVDKKCFERFDEMINKGALKEVETLHKQNLSPNLPAMKAIGVPELIEYLEQKISLEEAIDLSKTHTRQYAKRQRTFFNNKLKPDLTIKHCYQSEKNTLENIKKLLHISA